MANTFNRFSIFSDEDTENKESVNTSNPAKKSWADYSDDEEHQSSDKKDDKKDDKKINKEEMETKKEFDSELKKLTVLTVTHNIKFFDKEAQEFKTKANTRSLRVTTKQNYDNLKKLIGKFKTHGNDLNTFNYREQKDKIKFSNSLLETCYKDPKVPCCFVYPVAIIHTNENKTITRNEVKRDSKSFFTISDITYFPTQPQPTVASS